MTFAELLQDYKITMKYIEERFGIPYRTVQDWKAGKRVPPEYVIKMMDEILSNEE